jgi:hypothetical protein
MNRGVLIGRTRGRCEWHFLSCDSLVGQGIYRIGPLIF